MSAPTRKVSVARFESLQRSVTDRLVHAEAYLDAMAQQAEREGNAGAAAVIRAARTRIQSLVLEVANEVP